MYGHSQTTGQDGTCTQWLILLHTKWFQTFRLTAHIHSPSPCFLLGPFSLLYSSEDRKCNVTPRSEPLALIQAWLETNWAYHIRIQSHTLTADYYRNQGHTHSHTQCRAMACTRRWGLTCLGLATCGTGILHCFPYWMMPTVGLSTAERRFWMQLWRASWRDQEEEIQKPVSLIPIFSALYVYYWCWWELSVSMS